MKRVRHMAPEESAAGEYKDLLAILRAKEQRKAPNGVILGECARVIKLLLEENERLRCELAELKRTVI